MCLALKRLDVPDEVSGVILREHLQLLREGEENEGRRGVGEGQEEGGDCDQGVK